MSGVETNRDILYNGLSVLSTPLLFFMVIVDWYHHVVSNNNEDLIVPNPTSLCILLVEIVKILVVTWCWPRTDYILDSKFDNDGKKYGLPFSKSQKKFNDVDHVVGNGEVGKFFAVATKLVHLFNGVLNFLVGIAVCHLMLVLFGAPFISKWKLTLEFSCFLVTWLYFPLTFVIRPSSILQELVYISSWKHENSSLCRAKWRFLLTLFGAWIGAVVMPLDWDRPWQQWPVPCVFSSFVTYSFINLTFFLYLMYKKVLQGPTFEHNSISSQKPSKSPLKSKSKYF